MTFILQLLDSVLAFDNSPQICFVVDLSFGSVQEESCDIATRVPVLTWIENITICFITKTLNEKNILGDNLIEHVTFRRSLISRCSCSTPHRPES